MQLFIIAGIITTKIQRNVIDETDETKRLGGYTTAALGGLVAGCISLAEIAFL